MRGNAQSKPAESPDLANPALAIVPEKDGYVRSLIYLGFASAYHQMDDYAHTAEAFHMIIRHGRAAGNLVSEMLGISGVALMALEHGQLHLAFEIASQGIDRIERLGSLPAAAQPCMGNLDRSITSGGKSKTRGYGLIRRMKWQD